MSMYEPTGRADRFKVGTRYGLNVANIMGFGPGVDGHGLPNVLRGGPKN